MSVLTHHKGWNRRAGFPWCSLLTLSVAGKYIYKYKMNRWKTKKKANKDAEAAARPSTDSDQPPVPALKASKTFRLGRKVPEPEVKKEEFSLENALPSSDDFRTSLLMSGLSARFSMLREQDDPNSKIGKASDDSVLFPKRQSRLNDFGFQAHGLSDIAEVSSIHGSIRPPFAFGRTDSYHEGYGTDDDQGSIMGRKKPTEGNNLFGGRQKIYKIAGGNSASVGTGGAESSSAGGMSGRALYDDDVSQSAFQKLREREREQQQRAEPEEEIPSRSTSPIMTGYNRDRETSSTTTSTTRSSTAATSVTSQRTPSLSGPHGSANPNVTKGRRMYENGLDQQLHEQQHSAMSRIDTLTRQRTLGAQTPPLALTSPVTAPQGNDRWERHPMAGKQSMPNLRAASPVLTVTPLSTFDFGVKPINTTSEPKSFGASSPLSPPISDNGDTPILPLSTNDRGKVVATGAFAKPATAYDDNKYSQRQLQMASGRETPPLRKQSPPRAIPVRPPPPPPQMPRNRSDSNLTFASNRSRSNSAAQKHFQPHERISESNDRQSTVPEESPVYSGTFLSTSERSPDSPPRETQPAPQVRLPTPAEIYKMHRAVPKTTLERPPESQHPAHRQQALGQPPIQIQAPFQNDGFSFNDSRTPTIPILTPVLSSSNLSTPIVESPSDSPTLGPTSGLSSMRQHLRSDSNSSSVYSTMPSAGLVSRFPDHEDSNMPQNDYTVKDNAWDAADWDRGYDADYVGKYVEPSPPRNNEEVMPPLNVRSANVEQAPPQDARPSWEQEMDGHHVRSESSATQKEQQEFRNELAFRRRQVKENLKSFVETESRSTSPGPGYDSPRDFSAIKNPALTLLKSKTSRGSLAGKQNQTGQSKAMKMLGIGSPSNSGASSPVKQPWDNNSWKQEEEEMLRGIPKTTVSPPQNKAFRQARRDAQRDREQQLAQRSAANQRTPAETNDSAWIGEIKPIQRNASHDRFPPNIRTDPRDLSRDKKPPPVTYTQQRNENGQENGSSAASRSSRDRSSSDASVRSKSRNGRYKDDLARAMADGTSTSNQADLEVPPTRIMPRSPGTPSLYQHSPIPSPLPGVPSRSRSNSTLPQAGYFEPPQRSLTMQINTDIDHAAPRPSPAFSVNPTPSLMQPSPVPTPTSQGFQSKLPAPRKRSINKHEISEPKLISSTSRITTVNLPPGSSLQNGAEPHSAPPIPPVNPRRRQTRAMFGFGRKEELEELHALPAATQSTEEMSTFSADEGDKPKSRQKLRKSSSEGGNLNAKARQAAFAAPSPALPTGTFPPGSGSPPRRPVEGGMF